MTNKNGLQFGGPWVYGQQEGMTGHDERLTLLGYTHPQLAELVKHVLRISKEDRLVILPLMDDFLRRVAVPLPSREQTDIAVAIVRESCGQVGG